MLRVERKINVSDGCDLSLCCSCKAVESDGEDPESTCNGGEGDAYEKYGTYDMQADTNSFIAGLSRDKMYDSRIPPSDEPDWI